MLQQDPWPETDRLEPAGIRQADQQLNAPGSSRRKRHTQDPHFRQTEQSENEHRIEENVQPQGGSVGDGREYHPLNGAHGTQVHLGNAHEQVGDPHDPQIGHACFNKLRLGCKDQHQKLREKACQHKKYGRNQDGQLHADPHDLFNRPGVLPAPVLGGQHADPGGNTGVNKVQYEHNLTGKGACGKRSLAHPSQHDHVCGTDGRGDQVLAYNRKRQPEHIFIKSG